MLQQQIEIEQPFAVDAQGRIAFTSDPREILRNRVRMVIGTEIGERVMRPGYGTPLTSLLFEGDDDLTISIITSDIQRALETYEPGVVVQRVYADQNDELDGIINVNVVYTAANSAQAQTLSIPVNTAVLYRGGAVEEERNG